MTATITETDEEIIAHLDEAPQCENKPGYLVDRRCPNEAKWILFWNTPPDFCGCDEAGFDHMLVCTHCKDMVLRVTACWCGVCGKVYSLAGMVRRIEPL